MKYCFNSYTKCGIFFLKKKRHKNIKVGHKNHYIFTWSATKRRISQLKAHKTQGKSPACYSFVVNLCLWVEIPGQGTTGLVFWHPGAIWALIFLDQGVLPHLHGARAVAACSLTVSQCPWELPRPLQGEHAAKSLDEFASLHPSSFLGKQWLQGHSHWDRACSMAHTVPWLLLAPEPVRWRQHKHYSTLCMHLYIFFSLLKV